MWEKIDGGLKRGVVSMHWPKDRKLQKKEIEKNAVLRKVLQWCIDEQIKNKMNRWITKRNWENVEAVLRRGVRVKHWRIDKE